MKVYTDICVDFTRRAIASAVSLATLPLPFPAIAQETTTLGQIDVRATATNYTVPSSSVATGLGLSLRETPQSVSVVTEKQMNDQGLYSVQDVIKNAPGLTMRGTTNDLSKSPFYARGFEITNTIIDGAERGGSIYDGRSFIDSAVFESATVVRGSTGQMESIGEPSAAIELKRKRPTRNSQATIEAGIGSWKHRRAVIDASGPMNEDGHLRGRAIVAHDRDGAWKRRSDPDHTTMYGIIEYDVTPDTIISAGMHHERYNLKGSNGTDPFTVYGNPDDGYGLLTLGPRDNVFSSWGYRKQRITEIFASVEHQLNNGWQLEGRYGYNFVKYHELSDQASSNELGLGSVLSDGSATYDAFKEEGDQRQHSLSLNLSGDYTLFGNEHLFSAGVSFNDYNDLDNPKYDSTPFDVENIYTFNGNSQLPEFTSTGKGGTASRLSSVYASTQLKATSRLAFIAGGRLAHWVARNQNPSEEGSYTERGSKTVLTPFLGTTYSLDHGLGVYASYSRIFNPKLYHDSNRKLLDPETGNTLEAGLKGEWFEGKLNASAAVYRSKKENYPAYQGDLEDGSAYYSALDGAKGKGWELTLSGEITPSWAINAAYTHSSVDGEGDSTGQWLPTNQVQLATSYRINEFWTVGGDLLWQSRTWYRDPDQAEAYNDPLVQSASRQGGYGVLNLMTQFDITREASLSLQLNNAFDKTYKVISGQNSYGEPRNVMALLRYRIQ